MWLEKDLKDHFNMSLKSLYLLVKLNKTLQWTVVYSQQERVEKIAQYVKCLLCKHEIQVRFPVST